MTQEECKSFLKVVLLGDSGVGKTSLMHRFVNNQFSKNYRPTIGTDFLFKAVDIQDKTVMLQIWDTAGQERFRSLGVTFYRGADCCIIVYDVTCKESFDSVSSWYNEFLLQCSCANTATFPFLILGNKIDVPFHLIKVDLKKAKEWCDHHRITHATTSASTGLNVNKMFLELSEAALRCQACKHPQYHLKSIQLNEFHPSLGRTKKKSGPFSKCLC